MSTERILHILQTRLFKELLQKLNIRIHLYNLSSGGSERKQHEIRKLIARITISCDLFEFERNHTHVRGF